jgi:hypothetical protein
MRCKRYQRCNSPYAVQDRQEAGLESISEHGAALLAAGKRMQAVLLCGRRGCAPALLLLLRQTKSVTA